MRISLGDSIESLSNRMAALVAEHSELKDAVAEMNEHLSTFSCHVINAVTKRDNLELNGLTDSAPPHLTVLTATFAPASNPAQAVDVAWRLRPLVKNAVLRLPAGFLASTLFGHYWPKGKTVLNVSAALQKLGEPLVESNTIVIVENGRLQSDLIMSAAGPSNDGGTGVGLGDIKQMLQQHIFGRHGVEVGGPSETYRGLGVYDGDTVVDLVNYAASTMWAGVGTAGVNGKGRGIVSDGSKLLGVPDADYDFFLGSHYLEHLTVCMCVLSPFDTSSILRFVCMCVCVCFNFQGINTTELQTPAWPA